MTKTTYLAFDVHAATIALGLLETGQVKPEVWEIANDPATIRKTVQRLRRGRDLRCCYEAGPCGYVLQRQLTAIGIPCDVIAPSLIPQKPGDRVKTDRRSSTTSTWCCISIDRSKTSRSTSMPSRSVSRSRRWSAA